MGKVGVLVTTIGGCHLMRTHCWEAINGYIHSMNGMNFIPIPSCSTTLLHPSLNYLRFLCQTDKKCILVFFALRFFSLSEKLNFLPKTMIKIYDYR